MVNDDPSTLKVINMWAAPGVGKSTTTAGLFNLMKVKGFSVEMVTEYAKDLTYAKNYGDLRHQLAILGEQDRRLRRLVGQTEWVITDSPLPLGVAYMTPEYLMWLPQATRAAFDRYDNYDFYLRRVKPYSTQGRNQTEEEARSLDTTIHMLFLSHRTYEQSAELDGDQLAPHVIARHLGLIGSVPYASRPRT